MFGRSEKVKDGGGGGYLCDSQSFVIWHGTLALNHSWN